MGAGMSGLLAAHRLQQAGVPFVVFEKDEEVGGTWWENTYPGCRVDNPSHNYSYSFAQRDDWPMHYSTQDVLAGYFRDFADEHGLRRHIHFGTEVESATWSDADRGWTVRTRAADGSVDHVQVDAVISASGQLNRPHLPEIPGRDTFAGTAFHSARWPADLDLAGKRVAVIGTGASAAQFIPIVAERAADVVIFQRTPAWFAPTPDYHAPVEDGLRWLYRHVPYYSEWNRFWIFWTMGDGQLAYVTGDPEWEPKETAVSAMNGLAAQRPGSGQRATARVGPARGGRQHDLGPEHLDPAGVRVDRVELERRHLGQVVGQHRHPCDEVGQGRPVHRDGTAVAVQHRRRLDRRDQLAHRDVGEQGDAVGDVVEQLGRHPRHAEPDHRAEGPVLVGGDDARHPRGRHLLH